jgi:hypothetical protein
MLFFQLRLKVEKNVLKFEGGYVQNVKIVIQVMKM